MAEATTPCPSNQQYSRINAVARDTISQPFAHAAWSSMVDAAAGGVIVAAILAERRVMHSSPSRVT